MNILSKKKTFYSKLSWEIRRKQNKEEEVDASRHVSCEKDHLFSPYFVKLRRACCSSCINNEIAELFRYDTLGVPQGNSRCHYFVRTSCKNGQISLVNFSDHIHRQTNQENLSCSNIIMLSANRPRISDRYQICITLLG